MLRLHTVHQISSHRPSQNRILARVFKVASIARLASDVDATADGHIEPLSTKLTPDHVSIEKCRIRIPARSSTKSRRQQRSVTALVSRHTNANRRVRQIDIRNTKPIDPRHETGAEVRPGRQRSTRPQNAPTSSMNHLNLLIERHL